MHRDSDPVESFITRAEAIYVPALSRMPNGNEVDDQRRPVGDRRPASRESVLERLLPRSRRRWSRRNWAIRANVPGLANLAVSPPALRFVQEQGGRLFVWSEEFGGGFAVLRASAQPPPGGREFSQHRLAHLVLFLALEDVAGGEVRVDLSRWPRRRLVARSSKAAVLPGGDAGLLDL